MNCYSSIILTSIRINFFCSNGFVLLNLYRVDPEGRNHNISATGLIAEGTASSGNIFKWWRNWAIYVRKGHFFIFCLGCVDIAVVVIRNIWHFASSGDNITTKTSQYYPGTNKKRRIYSRACHKGHSH